MITGMPSHWDWIRSNSASPSMPPHAQIAQHQVGPLLAQPVQRPSALSAVSTS